MVPGVSLTQFDRYAAPSCEIAAIILAAIALDDPRPQRALAPAMAVAAAILLALLVGRADLASMLRTSQHALVVASLAWGLTAFGLAAFLLDRTPSRTVLAAFACVDAVALFCVPLLAGARQPSLDAAPIAVLQRSLKLGRFASVGGIWPNYGAMFRLAGINSNVLPDPRNWVDHVRHALLPSTDGQNFFPSVSDGLDVLARLRAYEHDGVSLVLVPAGSEPFHEASAANVSGPWHPWVVGPGASFSVALPSTIVHPGDVDAVAVTVGTFAGVADGTLRATLCQERRCAVGQVPLAGALDNARLTLRFDQPLAIDRASSPILTLDHAGGTHDVAIWMRGPARPAGLTLFYRTAASDRPVFVTRAGGLDIYRLPHPAPYFATNDPRCVLTASSRTELVAACPGRTVLTRLELFFPGWHATIDGKTTRVLRAADPLFEAVALPAGRHLVRFAYAPPGARLSWACLLSGVLLLAGTLGRAPAAFCAERFRMTNLPAAIRDAGSGTPWPAPARERPPWHRRSPFRRSRTRAPPPHG